MLLSTVVQQLGDICFDVADLLSAQQRPVTGSETSQSGPEGTLEGVIWFGRYSIEVLGEMRDTLVHNLIILHLHDLQSFLTQLKSKIDRKHGA